MTLRSRLAVLAVAALTVAAVPTALAAARADGAVARPFILISLFLGLAFAGVGGLLVALRPGNLIGPALAAGGSALVAEYGLRAWATLGGGPAAAGWLGFTLDPVFFPGTLLVVLLLFPDGAWREQPRGIRGLVLAVVGLTALEVLLVAARPGELDDGSWGRTVPWTGVLPAGWHDVLRRLAEGINTVLVWLLLVALVVLVVRRRRAGAVARRQFVPLELVALGMVGALLLQVGGSLTGSEPAEAAGVVLLVSVVGVGLPAALAVAALRYRLWDLDRVIVAAIVYAGLAGLIALVYLALVLAVASLVPEPVTSVLATVVVAALFAPVRDRLTRWARRMVYGIRATPYEALVALPAQLAETREVDDVLAETATILAAGLGARGARVRAFLDGGGHREAWAGTTGADGALVAVGVRHLGTTVGEVAVLPSPDRPLSTSDRRLLGDLAAQAGAAIRGVALAADLAASRQRLVEAQLTERRRLERDLHDGAQQQLVELSMRLERVAREVPAAATALDAAREQADRCLADLRDLSRGIYPPVLAVRGLAAALRSRVRESSVPVTVVAPDLPRFDPAVELTVYFCCVEALANVAKHAGSSASATLTLMVVDDRLIFEIIDDGTGFDGSATSRGSGLTGVADRLGALGGRLAVRSAPGDGTTVTGELPLAGGLILAGPKRPPLRLN